MGLQRAGLITLGILAIGATVYLARAPQPEHDPIDEFAARIEAQRAQDDRKGDAGWHWDAGPTPEGCSLEACRALRGCGIRFEAGPRTVMCLARTRLDAIPADFDEAPYCLEACKRMGGGAIAGCMQDRAVCADGGSHAPEEFDCPGSTGSEDAEPTCELRCEDEQRTCDAACPADTFASCMQCSDRCGAAWSRCYDACPRVADATGAP